MDNRSGGGSQLEFGDDEQAVALRKAWDRTLRALTPKLTAASDSFLRSTEPISLDFDTLVLATPSRFALEWLEKRFREAIRLNMVTQLSNPNLIVKFVVAPVKARPPLQPKSALIEEPKTDDEIDVGDANPTKLIVLSGGQRQAMQRRQRPIPPEFTMPINSKYTFDSFVVGKSNRLAHAGAESVAKSLGSFNPLFIYGPPGLGKSHLMQAIGNAVLAERPETQVAYVSGESFTNGYIAALRDKKSDDFRNIYRNVDLWLVDDIQTIAGKEHTKEEFFHTFNTLQQLGKQVVLSADRSPRELRLMDERLKSRFESGLIADVSPPDHDLRVEILHKKAILDGLHIPDDVLSYMASLIQSNIRALEGALIKLVAFASITAKDVTKDLARDVLGGYFVSNRRLMSAKEGDYGEIGDDQPQLRALPLPDVVSRLGALHESGEEQFRKVIQTVASYFDIDPRYIAGEGSATTSRRKEIAGPRQIAMYLTREKLALPVTELAHLFGDVSHSAISHAHKKMAVQMKDDPQLLSTIRHLLDRLG